MAVHSPNPPDAPPPPPPPPSVPDVSAVAAAARRRAAMAKGSRSTLITGPEGVTTPSGRATTSLLGD